MGPGHFIGAAKAARTQGVQSRPEKVPPAVAGQEVASAGAAEAEQEIHLPGRRRPLAALHAV